MIPWLVAAPRSSAWRDYTDSGAEPRYWSRLRLSAWPRRGGERAWTDVRVMSCFGTTRGRSTPESGVARTTYTQVNP